MELDMRTVSTFLSPVDFHSRSTSITVFSVHTTTTGLQMLKIIYNISLLCLFRCFCNNLTPLISLRNIMLET